MTKQPIVEVVVGPTAAGKTAYGIELAKKLGGAVISADSRQVYVGMNIGTAKIVTRNQQLVTRNPHDVLTADTAQSADHYLLDIREPDDPMTLAQWQQAAFQVIEHVLAADQVPILVGGTMLYVDSIVRNFSVPEVAPNEELRRELESKDASQLYQDLQQKDPAAMSFIEPHHKQRMIRALEVITATGQPFSAQRQQQPSPYQFEITGIFPGWEELEQRIRARIDEMMQQGLLEETQALQKQYGDDLPLLKTMNYKQAAAVLAGELSEVEVIEAMVRANLQYAKRQMQWWRNRYTPEEISWIS